MPPRRERGEVADRWKWNVVVVWTVEAWRRRGGWGRLNRGASPWEPRERVGAAGQAVSQLFGLSRGCGGVTWVWVPHVGCQYFITIYIYAHPIFWVMMTICSFSFLFFGCAFTELVTVA